jgi:aminopeptidase N
MMMGTNESLYPWMDEGFTTYAEGEVSAYYDKVKNVQNEEERLPLNHAGSYRGYYYLVSKKLDEPLSTHADHYNTNFGYSINAYSRGDIFLEQLGYIVSDSIRDKILLEYYRLWRFKHPNASDFVKVAQDVSGIQLDWYKEYFVYTTKTIDYSIDSLWSDGQVSKIRLRRIGQMPMPIDLQLTFKDSTKEIHTIPLDLMFGNKPAESNVATIVDGEWNWTNPTYTVEFKHPLTDLVLVEIDPTKRMADVDQKNNTLKLNW